MNGDADKPNDKLPPHITGQFDQFGAMWRDWAGVVGSYFKALVLQGFTREEALVLTREWQSIVVLKVIASATDKK